MTARIERRQVVSGVISEYRESGLRDWKSPAQRPETGFGTAQGRRGNLQGNSGYFPAGAVPVEDECRCWRCRRRTGVPDCPRIRAGHGAHGGQLGACWRRRGGGLLPGRAVPVQHQILACVAGVAVGPDGPGVRRRERGHAEQGAALSLCCGGVRRGDVRPDAAVPPQRQCFLVGPVGTDGPGLG